MAKNKDKEKYYVDPKVFSRSLRTFYESDNLTDDLAENINKIAYGLSYSSSFINYTYKEEMIGDALIKMYSALKRKKYSFDKRTERGGEDECNPFSYFTTIAYNAFVNRIKKEKRHHEAENNYRERVYAEIMSDPKTCNNLVYVSPTKSDDDDYYNED